MRILVSRTDRLGDVALTLPLCGLLRARLGATVVFLGRGYTRPVLEASAAVDAVLDWDTVANASFAERRTLVRGARADVVLHVFPRAAIAWAALAAGVPRRIGTTHRWYHWLTCNVREPLERRASPLHEAQLNVRLARTLLPADDLALAPAALASWAALAPRVPVPTAVAPLVGGDRFTVVVHPRSAGSAREWPLDHWRALIDALPPGRFRVLVTGSAAEGASMRAWLDALPAHAHDLTGRFALDELLAVLGAADGVVAASTGPLHLAALLGTPTLGLFSPARPLHAGRWGPIGPNAGVLEAPNVVPPNVEVPDVAAPDVRATLADGLGGITPAAVAARVERWAHDRAARMARSS